MSYEIVKGDKRLRAFRDWKPWLEASANLYSRFIDEIDFSPFDANEQTVVGLFAAGAAAAGYLPLIEYGLNKKTKKDFRRRKKGRADLWIDCGIRCYSFEFKRSWYSATIHNLRKTHDVAKADIDEILPIEYDMAVAVSISYIRDDFRIKIYEDFAKNLEIDYCIRFGPKAEGGAYLFLSIKGQ